MNEDLLNEIIKQNDITNKLLHIITDDMTKSNRTLDNIFKELKSEADEGEYISITDTTSTSYKIYDFNKLYGHNIRGFTIENTGSQSLDVGFNMVEATLDSIDADISLIKTPYPLTAKSQYKLSQNRKIIRNILVKASVETTYLLTLVW